MIVALTVLALLMLIGGLAAMVQGIPFVRLEVGWTMVIAGTVGASAGAVLLGITAAVARLGRIERALDGRASARPVADLAPAEPGAAPVRAARSEPVLSPVLPPIPFPAAAPPVPEPRPAEPTGLGGGAALAAGAAMATAGLAASELRLTRAEDPDLSAGRQDGSRQDFPQQDFPQQDFPQQEPPRHEVPHHEPAPYEASPPEPIAHEPPAHEPTPYEPVPQPPADEPRPEPPHEPAPPAPPAPEPVAEAPAPPAPAYEDLPPEEPPGKTVIGTYDSGGNTYTMYADGTIDADTPAGRFHFASIEELKVFRTAGGEGAARSA